MHMAIKFYTDSHIAKAVAVQLRKRGVDIVRCQEVGKDNAPDDAHLTYATSQGRTIITADKDYLVLDTLWRESGRHHAGIVYLNAEK